MDGIKKIGIEPRNQASFLDGLLKKRIVRGRMKGRQRTAKSERIEKGEDDRGICGNYDGNWVRYKK
jgi:hypothetical protein